MRLFLFLFLLLFSAPQVTIVNSTITQAALRLGVHYRISPRAYTEARHRVKLTFLLVMSGLSTGNLNK